MVTTRMAMTHSNGTRCCQSRTGVGAARMATIPTADRIRKAVGVLSATAAMKKYHQPPRRMSPNRYDGGASAFMRRSDSIPSKKDCAGIQGATRRTRMEINLKGRGWSSSAAISSGGLGIRLRENLKPAQITRTSVNAARRTVQLERWIKRQRRGESEVPRIVHLAARITRKHGGRNKSAVNFERIASPTLNPRTMARVAVRFSIQLLKLKRLQGTSAVSTGSV